MSIPKNILRAACVQSDSSEDWEENLDQALRDFRTAVLRGAKIIGFPENFIWRGKPSKLNEISRTATPHTLMTFQKEARRLRCDVLLGSMPEAIDGSRKVYNTTYVIAASGRITACYRKMNLFNIHLPNVQYHESQHFREGKEKRVVTAAGVKVGLSICYDVRFPELYRALILKGARILFVPAHFAEQTGRAHWEVLLRARAIENQAFVLAPDQAGINRKTGARSFGNSLMIDPWGKILKKGTFGRKELLIADFDLGYQTDLRRQFPVLKGIKI